MQAGDAYPKAGLLGELPHDGVVGVLALLDTAAGQRPEAGERGQGGVVGEQDAAGTFLRSIVKVTDPARYGLTVSDYFV